MYEVFMQAIKEAKSISTLKEIIREVNADEGLSGRGRQFILIQEAYKKMKEIPLEHVFVNWQNIYFRRLNNVSFLYGIN